jgi:hypothetical protein
MLARAGDGFFFPARTHSGQQGYQQSPYFDRQALGEQGSYFGWRLVAARFKPGFLTEWRLCRRALSLSLGTRLRRQRRVTHFVALLGRIRGFNLACSLGMSLGA